MEVYTI